MEVNKYGYNGMQPIYFKLNVTVTLLILPQEIVSVLNTNYQISRND